MLLLVRLVLKSQGKRNSFLSAVLFKNNLTSKTKDIFCMSRRGWDSQSCLQGKGACIGQKSEGESGPVDKVAQRAKWSRGRIAEMKGKGAQKPRQPEGNNVHPELSLNHLCYNTVVLSMLNDPLLKKTTQKLRKVQHDLPHFVAMAHVVTNLAFGYFLQPGYRLTGDQRVFAMTWCSVQGCHEMQM